MANQPNILNLANLFQTVTGTLSQNRESLNEADSYNHDHGDNMVDTFEVITRAMKEKKGADPADQLAYASEILRQRKSGSAQKYADGLSQASREFQGQQVTPTNAMTLIQTLLGGGQAPQAQQQAGGLGGGPAGGFGGGLDQSLLSWLRAQHTTETWLVAVSSSMQADTAIIDGDSVMAMGGFSGSDPAMTPTRLADLVRTGRLRYVMGGVGIGGGAGGITSVAQTACTAVPASTWGGTTGTVYDCAGKADAIITAGADFIPQQGPGAGGPGGGGIGGGNFAEIQACMAEAGVTLPAPGAGDAPQLDARTLEAMTACGLPAGAGPQGGAAGGQQQPAPR